MEKSEIMRRLEKIASHAVHVVGETPFVMSLDDGIAVKDAIALLKEQEPKKIIRKQMSCEDPDGTITYYAEWHCPHCNKVVQKGFGSPWLKYCFNCGKPILWD